MNKADNIMKYTVFCTEKMEVVQHVSKNAASVLVDLCEIQSLGGSSTCSLRAGWVLSKD